MFTWICPQCGREVPPSYSECPTCAENRLRAAQGLPPQSQTIPQGPQAPPPPPMQPPPMPASPMQAAAQPTMYAPPIGAQPGVPPPYHYPVQQQAPPPLPLQQGPYGGATPLPPQGQPLPPPAYGYPPYEHPQAAYAPPPPMYTVGEEKRKGIPGWLAAIGAFAVLGIVLFAAYKLLANKSGDAEKQAAVTMENPQQAGAGAAGSNAFAKYIEVTGIRLSEENKKLKVRYLVVNHSGADISELKLKITLHTTAEKADAAPIAAFDAVVGSIGPWESRDLSAELQTNLRAYEVPDWQFLKVVFEVTSPQ